MALLELRDVAARYGPVRALEGVSLAVEQGQIVAVLGASRAGRDDHAALDLGTVKRSGQILFEEAARAPRAGVGARLGVAHVPEGRGTGDVGRGEPQARAYVHRGSIDDDIRRVSEYFPWISSRLDQHAGTLRRRAADARARAGADEAIRACSCSTSPRSGSHRS